MQSPTYTIILVRHGVTAWNNLGKLQGQRDIPLHSDGQYQAHLLGERLQHLQIDHCYSSPLARAHQTASIALPDQHIILEPRLKEIDFGIFEGRIKVSTDTDQAWQTWLTDPFTKRSPEGESYQELRQRAVAWLESVPKHGTTIAFTHSGTIQMLISHVIGVEHPRWRKRLTLAPTSLSCLVYKGSEVVITSLNDTQHLNAPSAAHSPPSTLLQTPLSSVGMPPGS